MPMRIEIRGVIIPNDYQWLYDWFEIDATSPGRVNQSIRDANGDELEVIINSGGGDVFSGSEIYTAIKEYPSNVTVKIVGVAASAASVIAMAGNKIVMSPTAQIMIHNARTWTEGDKRDHQHTADFLRTIDAGIANAYRLKTGMPPTELSALMNRESWLNAQDAKEKGFIDEIMFDADNQLRAVAAINDNMIPQKVLDKLRNEIMNLKLKGELNMEGINQTPSAVASTTVPTPAPATPQAAAPAPAPAPAVDAAAQERARLQAIDAIAPNIDPALVNEAKYGDNPMSAQDLAFKAMKEGKMINAGVFDAAVAANKAAGTDNVKAQSLQQDTEKEFDLNSLKDVNAIFGAMAANSNNLRRGY